MTETSSGKFYFEHIRFLVLGKPHTREGISELLDMLCRNSEAHTD
ncbi:Ger(x)C family spore germination protein [Paenibacillus endophyticus]